MNESRVSQLHARAIRRLRDALGNTMAPAEAAAMLRSTVLQFLQKPATMKAQPRPKPRRRISQRWCCLTRERRAPRAASRRA